MHSSPADLARGRLIKIAFGDLVRLVGDDAVAATITRVSRATIARYRSLSSADAEYFPPADVLADLERVAGACPVTELLCHLAGGAFVAEPEAPVTGADLFEKQSALAKEFADVTRALCAGMRDGHWDPADGAALEKQCDDLIVVAIRMRALARFTKGETA